MERMSIREIAGEVKGRIIGNPELSIANVVRDNRDVQAESLFVALRGLNHDGHAYIKSSFENGAAAVLAEEGNPYLEGLSLGEKQALILTANTQAALEDLGCAYRRRFAIPVVGVTGSVGKTSCKDITAAALSGALKVVKTEKNYNHELGVPLTLFRIDRSTQAAVIEMGMDHAGEIDRFARMAQPQYGVITNIGLSHIENLGSQEGILRAKLEILNHMPKDGILFLNGDDPLLYGLKGTLPVKTEYFGFKEHNDARALETDMTESGNLRVRLLYQGEEYRFVLNTPGTHMAYNALPAIMIARHLGLEPKKIIAGLTQYVPTELRLQIKSNEAYRVLDDSYNASPDSMEAAIRTLVQLPGEGRRVASLGDMFEMGAQAEEAHRRVGRFLAGQTKVQTAILIGAQARWMYEEARKNPAIQCYYFETTKEMEKKAFDILQKNDIILVKASHGMRLDLVSSYILDRK